MFFLYNKMLLLCNKIFFLCNKKIFLCDKTVSFCNKMFFLCNKMHLLCNKMAFLYNRMHLLYNRMVFFCNKKKKCIQMLITSFCTIKTLIINNIHCYWRGYQKKYLVIRWESLLSLHQFFQHLLIKKG